MNLVSEVLHKDAGYRRGRQGYKREIGADVEQKKQRAHREHNRIGAVHDRGPQQHAHRVQIVGEAGHDIAGPIALIESRILLFKMAEKVITQVKLDLARNANQNPTLRIEKHALHQRNRHQRSRKQHDSAMRNAVVQLVDGLLQHFGK